MTCSHGEKKELYGECVWYSLCKNGVYESTRCSRILDQMFDPEKKECVEKSKIAIKDKCNAYKECVILEGISHVEKWKTEICNGSLHFDPISKKCIDSNDSTCGKFNNRIIVYLHIKCSWVTFFIINKNSKFAHKINVKMEAFAKKRDLEITSACVW